MADINYLPRNWARNMKSAAAASAGLRQLLTSMDPGYEVLYTHFLGDALPGEWAAAKTNGTAAAVTVASSKLTCTAGTDDNGYAGNAFGLFWKGDNGFYMESVQAVDNIATVKVEVGVTDATADAGAVNAKATPTATADDFVVVILDTDDNAEVDILSADDTVVVANAENIFTIASATNFRTEFRGQNDTCSVFVNGVNKGTGGIEGGDLITPWWFCQARAGSASRILTVEYAIMIGPSGLAIP